MINFPYTDAHQLNLDWILKTIKNLVTKTDNLDTSEISIINFGAEPGDPSIDNSAAIENALSVCREIYIPDGIFYTSSITIADNKTIFGPGTLKLLPNSNTSLLEVTGNNVTIYGIILDGSCDDQTIHAAEEDGAAIYINGGDQCKIINCTIVNAMTSGIYNYQGKYSLIVGNHIKNSKWKAGITVTYNDNAQYAIISQNICENNETDGILATGMYNLILANICNNNGLQLQSGTRPSCGIYVDSHSGYTKITNNICISNSFAGIEISENSTSIYADGNICTENTQYGIFCNGHYCTIRNNSCIGNNPDNTATQSDIAVYDPTNSNYAHDNLVTSNIVITSNEHGIVIINSIGNTITDNIVRGAVSDAVWSNSMEGNYLTDSMHFQLPTSAPNIPIDGSCYVDDTGLHVYVNGSWSIIA